MTHDIATLNPARAWNRFWFSRVSARPLAVFRILFGLIALEHLALLWPDASLWLSDIGYLQGTEALELAGPLRWSPLQHWQSPATIHAVMGATALAALAVVVGWRTRLATIALYLGLLAIHHRNLLTVSGADTLLQIMAFWLMLSPAGATLSLDDARRRRRRPGDPAAEPLIVPWAQRMMQIQLVIVYLVTALAKAGGSSWQSGVAVHDVLSNRELRRWTFGLLGQPELINALTYGTIVLEVALPLLIWFRATRPWVILAGVALHAGIVLTVNIPVFGELMCATYLLFLTAAELPWRESRASAPQGESTAHTAAPHVTIRSKQAEPVSSTHAL